MTGFSVLYALTNWHPNPHWYPEISGISWGAKMSDFRPLCGGGHLAVGRWGILYLYLKIPVGGSRHGGQVGWALMVLPCWLPQHFSVQCTFYNLGIQMPFFYFKNAQCSLSSNHCMYVPFWKVFLVELIDILAPLCTIWHCSKNYW